MRRPVQITMLLVSVIFIWFIFSPPQFWLNFTKSVDMTDPVVTGNALVDHYNCRACHQIGDEGALKAPDLTGVTQRKDKSTLYLWLQNPRAVKGDTAMPNFNLSDSEIEAILLYLAALDNQSPGN